MSSWAAYPVVSVHAQVVEQEQACIHMDAIKRNHLFCVVLVVPGGASTIFSSPARLHIW